MAQPNKITHIMNRVERAKSLLLSQFKDSPNINTVLEVFIDELQALEDNLIELQELRTLRGAFGVFLDVIGESVGVLRGSYTDQDYKNAIKIAMAKSNTSATREDILKIAILLSNDPFVRLRNHHPYMLEMIGFLECITESEGGIKALSELFPVATAIKISQRKGKPFALNSGNQGFGSGAKLNSLVYHDYGISQDSRFSTATTEIIVLPEPPSNTSPPIVVGLNEVGNTLTVSIGAWTGDTPITYTYQWLRNGEVISGEADITYTLVEADEGNLVSCVVTATNAVGSISVQSNAINVSADTPPTSEFTTNLGLVDGYGTRTLDAPMDFKTAYAAININSDGTTTQTNTSPLSEEVLSDQWLATTSVGVGDDYTVSYTIVSGVTPIGMAPNTTYSLSASRVLSVQVSGEFPTVAAGTYLFTIRSISDPTISQSRTIQLGAELVDAYN
jgi:hypothetical protein